VALEIDHVAIAVSDLDAAAERYSRALGAEAARETVESEGVNVAIMRLGGARVELISPIGEGGPIAAFIKKRGEGIHHMALRTDDIDAEVSRMEGCGLRFLGKVRDGSEGTRVTFIHPKSLNGVLTELCTGGTPPGR